MDLPSKMGWLGIHFLLFVPKSSRIIQIDILYCKGKGEKDWMSPQIVDISA
jgi:hypothetical protein